MDRLPSIAHRHVYQPEACFQNSIEPMLRGTEADFSSIEWEKWVPSLTVINALFGAFKRLTPPPRSTPSERVRHGVGFERDWPPRTSSGERFALGKYADGYGSARRPCVSGANWRNNPIAIADRLMRWNLSAWVVIAALLMRRWWIGWQGISAWSGRSDDHATQGVTVLGVED